MKYLVIILFTLSSCGASYHLKQSERHLRKAIEKGAEVADDTVYVTKEIIIPEVKLDTVFKAQQKDTVFLTKDKLKIKYVKLPGDSVFIQGECEPDTVKIEIPVEINREISAGYSIWKLIMFSLIALVIGYILRAILR